MIRTIQRDSAGGGAAARLGAWLDRRAPLLLAATIAAYIVTFAILSGLKLAWFRQGFDMAGNEQVIWNTLHGRPFRTSIFAFMQYDFDDGPVLLELPLALLYGIYPSPYTLLALQTIALGLAAWPVYLLGRDLLPARWHALALALIYLLHPTTQHINMYEFQLRSFAIPFALGALLFLRRARLWPYALCLLLMMCTKTEAGFTLVAFGIYALLLRRRWPFAAIPLVLGPLWVAVALGVIVPRFSQGDFIGSVYSYNQILPLLTDPVALIRLIGAPRKLTFVAQLLGLQAFLALLSPIAILALPILALSLIAPDRNVVQFSLFYQYPALIYPFLLVAAADGLARLSGWLGRPPAARARWASAGVAALLAIAVVANLLLGNVVRGLAGNRETPERAADARAIIAQVPPGAALGASTFLAPHLAQREQLYFFPGNGSYPLRYVEERADYLVADRRPGGARPSPEQIQERDLLERFIQSGGWRLVRQAGDFVLLQRQR